MSHSGIKGASAQIITFPTTLAAPVQQARRCASRMSGVAILIDYRCKKARQNRLTQQHIEAIKVKQGAIVCLMNAAETIKYEIAVMANGVNA